MLRTDKHREDIIDPRTHLYIGTVVVVMVIVVVCLSMDKLVWPSPMIIH